MAINHIVVDDFSEEPHKLREAALGLDFEIEGNFPGRRAASAADLFLRLAVQSALPRPILHWPNESSDHMTGHNGFFQLSTAGDRTWVHADLFRLRLDTHDVDCHHWGGVHYLTPDAPANAGTGFYRHKANGHTHPDGDENESAGREPNAENFDEFELIDTVSNRFNRLVLFDSDQYHAAGPSFGSDHSDGRLFRVFFFATAL